MPVEGKSKIAKRIKKAVHKQKSSLARMPKTSKLKKGNGGYVYREGK
jgi:hypothetical protein